MLTFYLSGHILAHAFFPLAIHPKIPVQIFKKRQYLKVLPCIKLCWKLIKSHNYSPLQKPIIFSPVSQSTLGVVPFFFFFIFTNSKSLPERLKAWHMTICNIYSTVVSCQCVFDFQRPASLQGVKARSSLLCCKQLVLFPDTSDRTRCSSFIRSAVLRLIQTQGCVFVRVNLHCLPSHMHLFCPCYIWVVSVTLRQNTFLSIHCDSD